MVAAEPAVLGGDEGGRDEAGQGAELGPAGLALADPGTAAVGEGLLAGARERRRRRRPGARR